MSTSLPIPTKLADLDIPDDLKTCVRGFARPGGVHEFSVLLILIAMLSSLRSRGVTIEWMDGVRRPVLTFLYLDGHKLPARSWLDRAFGVVEACAEKPPMDTVGTPDQLTARFQALMARLEDRSLREKAKTDPEALLLVHSIRSELGRITDAMLSRRVSTEYPAADRLNYGFEFSPLIVSEETHLVEFANVTYRKGAWEKLCNGFLSEIGQTAPPTVVLCTSRQMVRRMWELEHSTDFLWPMLLPPTGGALGGAGPDEQEALAKWKTVASEASQAWACPPRTLRIGELGYTILTQVRDEAERSFVCRCTPERMAWALPHCATIAAWHHLTTGQEGDEISEQSWALAAVLSRYAIHAHTVASRSCGAPRFYPADELKDRERMVTKLKSIPSPRYRQLVQALPKRPPGYWKKLYSSLTASGYSGVGNVVPTAEEQRAWLRAV